MTTPLWMPESIDWTDPVKFSDAAARAPLTMLLDHVWKPDLSNEGRQLVLEH